MATNADYTLYYWPAPFRGHFIRAILTYAGANWEEGANPAVIRGADAVDQPVPFMGLPMLVNNQNGFSLSQMPAITYYLGERFNLLPADLEEKAMALKVINDANDVIDELTLQGGMMMWTLEAWTEFVPRLKRWMSFWEVNGTRHGLTLEHGYLLGTEKATIADIVTATLWQIMRERFPKLGTLLDEVAPKTAALAQRLWAEDPLAQFAKDTYEQYGDTYCGGYIEQSLRKVINND